MDKYIKALIAQNKKWEFECPVCHKKFDLPTKDVFTGNDTYDTTCPKCKNSITLTSLKSFIKDFRKSMEKLGIKVK